MEKLTLLYFLLGVIGPGGGTVVLVGLPNSTSILENLTSGTSIFTFSAPSTSTIPSQYPLIINTNPLTKAFKIVYTPPTYNVVLTGTPQLDYETNPNSFDLQIYVMDIAGATDLQILTVQLVDVNEPPVFLDNMANQAVVVYITEGSPIGIIYQIKASDPDNANNTLVYRLIPNNTAFMVSISGSVSSTKIFDYETDPHSYTMTVSVLDPNGLSVNGTLTVIITNINDETPYFIGVSAVYTIPEEQIPGTPVANVTALDPDADGFINTLLYSINPPTPYFTINQISGGIQIAMTIDREADPFRLHPTITLEIGVRDSPSGGHANKTSLTFYIQDLNDNPPMCRQYAFSTSVPETEVNGSLIIDLTGYCSDVDVESPNNLFNFTGLSGLGSKERFQLIPGSGKIVLIGNLNFEDPNNLAVGNEFTLTVQVQDIAAPYYTKNLYIYVKTIPVDEFPPVFNSSSYVFNVSELSPPGTRIGQLYATDKDYPFIAITYSIVAGGSTLGNTNIFWIDPSTGSLQLINNADYETTPIYKLTVQAENQGTYTSTVSVTVYIIEANDEKPICLPNSYSLSVPSNEVVGTNILNFKLMCTDRDSGPNSFRYFINSGNINNHFAFSPDAGSNVTSLVLAIPFDYSGGSDTTFIYNLRVYITDDNLLSASQRSIGVVQTGTVSITIYVYIPGLTTIKTTTTPRIIYMTTSVNTYSASAWYLPFVITIGCLLLLGLLGFLIYLLAKYCSCRTSPKPGTEPLISPPEKTKVKHDVFWEMTKINTVFDGEAQDPITGKIYEYNTRSGARRWKDTQQPIESTHTVPTVPHVAFVPSEPMPKSQDKSRRVSPRGTPVKREKTPANPPKEEDTKDVKPVTPNRLQTPPKEEPRNETNSNWSPLSPRLSPKVSPKIPKTPK